MRLELGEEVDEDKERHGADWQGTKQPNQLALTPLPDDERDQGRVSPCSADERWFSPSFGSSLWNFKIAYFGVVLNQAKLPMHVGVGSGVPA
eukprot:scaffold34241_cov57-Phaeocystis_antarctica.AAC.2